MTDVRAVTCRTSQQEEEIFPGFRATVIRQVMVYADTLELVDIDQGYRDLSIVGYMVKIRIEHLTRREFPDGGPVEEINDTHVRVAGAWVPRESFHALYEVD